jgi:hypothetical protein
VKKEKVKMKYKELIAKLEKIEKEIGVSLTDVCVDLENVSFKAHNNNCGWSDEEDAELVFVACSAAGMRAEEAGFNINKLFGSVIY